MYSMRQLHKNNLITLILTDQSKELYTYNKNIIGIVDSVDDNEEHLYLKTFICDINKEIQYPILNRFCLCDIDSIKVLEEFEK